MPPSESQKRASLKWDKENMIVLGCKVKKTQAEAFKAYCTIQGRTSNAVLRGYVLGCIGEEDAPGGTQEATGAHGGPMGIPVSLDTLKTAQRAAGATGESVPDFVARAVEGQEKRDKSLLSMEVEPIVTKGGEQNE